MTSLTGQTLFLLAVFVVFYVALVRPQLRRLKRHRDMLASLRPGLYVATVGGLVGRVVNVEGPDFLQLEVSDGVTVTVIRKSVDALVEPAAARSPAIDVSGRHTARTEMPRAPSAAHSSRH